MSVLELHRFSNIDRGPEANCDIACNMAATNREHCKMKQVSIFENGKGCCIGANIHDDNAELFLFCAQDSLG